MSSHSEGPYSPGFGPDSTSCSFSEGHLDLMTAVSLQNSDHGMLFDDPAQVRQWVASSATGSVCAPDSSYAVLSGMDQGEVVDEPSRTTSNFQDNVLTASRFSFQNQDGPHGSSLIPTAACNALSMEPALLDDATSNDDRLSFDPWTNSEHQYAIPSSADMVYTTSADSHRQFNRSLRNDSMWNVPGHVGDEYNSSNTISQVAWPSPSSVSLDPSLPSSHSQGSLFSNQLSSPASFTTPEDTGSNASNTEDSLISSLSLNYPAQVPMMSSQYDNYMQYDAARFVLLSKRILTFLMYHHSTLRPSHGLPQGFQRTQLSNLPFWQHQEQGPHVATVPGPMDIFPNRRLSGENDNTNARRNELYQIGPQNDGLYHCPFEVTEKCTHKPEKLKCNYE